VRTSDLAPDNSDLGASYGLLCAVDVCYALTGVPSCGICAVDTLELEQRGSGVGVALST
jgi:hypothetical protein